MVETKKAAKPRKPVKTPDCIYCGDCAPVWASTGHWHCEVDGGAWSADYQANELPEE